MEELKKIGRELGDAIYEIKGIAQELVDGATIYWQLDYPELAQIPWELASSNQEPHHHLLQRGISFVRMVPAAVGNPRADWPTGLNQTLSLVFAYGEADQEVPHREHEKLLQATCADYGVDLITAEIRDANALGALCREHHPHFVHLLAHGARAGNGHWGLRLAGGDAKGEAIARALMSGDTTPSLVTVAACDSANEENNTFGSVAYNLHVYGIPLVLASQFRLRTNLSVVSVDKIYGGLLGGEDPIAIVHGLRRQLAPSDDEGWANEVLYSRYRHESLSELSAISKQQAALRRARSIAKNPPKDVALAKAALKEEEDKLTALANQVEAHDPPDRAALAETYGLVGSLRRRAAYLGTSQPKPADLRWVCSAYEKGMKADANSHYCGINLIHLSLLAGDDAKANSFIPLVRFATENDISTGNDFWAYATAGELEVYAKDSDKAAYRYREFAENVLARQSDKEWKRDTIEPSEDSFRTSSTSSTTKA